MNNIVKEDIYEIINMDLPWEKLDNSTVLISGANSFITSYIVYALMERNVQLNTNIHVIAMCRNEQKAKERFERYISDERFTLLIQDVVDEIKISTHIDYCIHAASPAGIFSRHENPIKTYETNLLGCKNLLDFALNSNAKRFMFVSSVDVYGKVFSEKRLEEDNIGYLDLLNPRNAYSNGKRAAETLCSLYYASSKIETVIVRPYQVFGPGMTLGDGRLHGDFIYQLQNNKKITLKSDGKAVRSFMYIKDCTMALLTVLLKGENGNAYNVCDENCEANVLELANLYCDIVKKDTFVEFDYSQREKIEVKEAIPCVLGCSNKLRTLGWLPKTSLTEGVSRTITSYGGVI